jgi:hypothetical protein
VKLLPPPKTLLLTTLLLALPAAGMAAPQSAGGSGSIFTCVTSSGQRLTSDRPIAECVDREQRVLNRDGSLQRMLPPSMTAEELATKEARERKIEAEKAAKREAERSDRLLMQRYPSEEAHNRAREAALDSVRAALKLSEARIETLAAERKPLVDEAEFYKGRPLPPKLRHQFEANETATEAQRVLVINQKAELVRVNALYDTELARLRTLWAGAAPGSLGPLAMPQGRAAAAVVVPASNKTTAR